MKTVTVNDPDFIFKCDDEIFEFVLSFMLISYIRHNVVIHLSKLCKIKVVTCLYLSFVSYLE